MPIRLRLARSVRILARPLGWSERSSIRLAQPSRTSLWASRGKRAQPARRLGQEQLHVADPPFCEARLAVGQVQLPQAPEALVVAEALKLRRVRRKSLAPTTEGAHVVSGEILQSHEAQVSAPCELGHQGSYRGQRSSGEDPLLDEGARALLELIEGIVDRDRLEQHRAVRFQQPRAAPEEVSGPAPADRLDHLDRDKLVVAPTEIGVVAAEHLDSVAKPPPFDLLERVGVLVGGD